MPEQPFEQQPTPEIPPKPPLEKEPKERGKEVEKELADLEKAVSEEEKKAAAGLSPLPPSLPSKKPVKTETRRKIESILSEDLADTFQAMDDNQKMVFKQKAEETAKAIEILIHSAKATAKKIIKLIGEWLKLIPGMNKFFLEQETKIKTDRILELTKKKKEE